MGRWRCEEEGFVRVGDAKGADLLRGDGSCTWDEEGGEYVIPGSGEDGLIMIACADF